MKPIALLASAALVLGTAGAHATIDYRFDTSDPQGFSLLGGGALSYDPGGFLSVVDTSNTDNIFLVLTFASPQNWSTYLGGALSFQGKTLAGPPSDYGDFGTVTIYSGDNFSVQRDLAAGFNPPTSFTTFQAALSTAAWGANLPTILGAVTKVTFALESVAGPQETIGFDNFRVAAVPEPATWGMLLAGLGVMGAIARRPSRGTAPVNG